MSLDFFETSFRHQAFLLRFFLALLLLGYYKLKFDHLSGASGVQLNQLPKTSKDCGSNPAGPFFAN